MISFNPQMSGDRSLTFEDASFIHVKRDSGRIGKENIPKFPQIRQLRFLGLSSFFITFLIKSRFFCIFHHIIQSPNEWR